MKLSVIIPVYNERATILEVLKKVKSVPVEKEIIIIDDGSTDGTKEILKEIQETQDLKIIFKDKNEGKGAAIREGLKYVSGDVVVIQDADLEYDPMDWLKMLNIIQGGKADVVYGSRVLGRGEKSSLAFYLGGRFLSFLASILYRIKITDEPTCYKMFKVDVIRSIKLKCKGFEFCPEVTAKVAKKGYEIYEVPVGYKPRKIKEGKKIRWKDGVVAIWTLIKYRFLR
jgi:glycosyltransferase involved in cell wall biosynthesis